MNSQNSLSTPWSIPAQASLQSFSHQMMSEVAQRIQEVSLTPPLLHEFARTLIANWNTPQAQKYLSEILAKDSLLWDMFEVTASGLQVKKNSPILDAHFGDLHLDNNQKSSLRVVPGVILKRLIASIFGINLYSFDEHAPVVIIFNSGVIPTAVLNFEIAAPQDGQSGRIPELSLFTTVGEQKKLALSLSEGERLSSERILELTAAAVKPRVEVINLSPNEHLPYLAQQGDFRFALNTGVLDRDKQMYQTVFGYPRQIRVQAKLDYREPSIKFTPNPAGDFEVPWEILEEAVCQAATLAAQKNIFDSTDAMRGTSVSKKWSLSKDTLILLSQSSSQLHRLTPMSEREFLKITLKVTMTESGKAIDIIEYIVTSKTILQPANLVMSGSIYCARVPKILLARALRT